jgi:hypothetical protein
MVRRALRLAGVAATVVTILSAAPAQAQSPSPVAVLPPPGLSWAAIAPDSGGESSAGAAAVAALHPAAGPALDAASVAVRGRTLTPISADSAAALVQARAGQGFGQSEILMIVGGATFLVGAVIGDDAGTIIMIGGAAIGLYGLYRFLQEQ